MPERNVAAEVLRGLQEVREHRAGKRVLRETRIEPTPLSELDPGMGERIRECLDVEDAASHRSPVSATGESARDSGGENGEFDIEELTARSTGLDALRDREDPRRG